MKFPGPTFLRRRRRDRTVLRDAYRSLLEEARNPWLFLEGGIEDSLDGRFKALALVSGLLFTKLGSRGPEGERLAARLYERTFDDLDAGLRETGVGDASIARKVRKYGESFFGIGQAVRDTLKSSDPLSQLEELLVRNAVCAPEHTRILGTHLLSVADSFEKLAAAKWLDGASQ